MQPHLYRYWLNPKVDDPEQFDEEVREICDLYAIANEQLEQKCHLNSIDEMSGIQALERKAPTKSMKHGLIERVEHEYIRHGTLSSIANFEVATGRVLSPSIRPTRNEADFATHIENKIDTDPQGDWIFIVDRLNIHQSESLVRIIAGACEIGDELGIKGKAGILKSMPTRRAFLSCEHHRIRFVYIPKHTSWLNQIELWFSILARRLLKRASFTSIEQLSERILAFIQYFNQTLAKPFRWTYKRRPLTV